MTKIKKRFDCVEMKNSLQEYLYKKSNGNSKKLSEIIRKTAQSSKLMQAFSHKHAIA